jgi:hypothetical protein
MSDLWVSGDASLSPSSLHLAVDQFLDEALSAKRQLYLANSSSWICKFFQKGPSACRRGADCPYRHSKNDKPFVCKFWLRGLCLDVDTPISGATGLAQPLAWLADRKDSVLTYDATRDTVSAQRQTHRPA